MSLTLVYRDWLYFAFWAIVIHLHFVFPIVKHDFVLSIFLYLFFVVSLLPFPNHLGSHRLEGKDGNNQLDHPVHFPANAGLLRIFAIVLSTAWTKFYLH